MKYVVTLCIYAFLLHISLVHMIYTSQKARSVNGIKVVSKHSSSKSFKGLNKKKSSMVKDIRKLEPLTTLPRIFR